MACGLFQNVVPLLEMWSHMFQMQRSKDSQVGGQQKDSINVVVEVTYLSVYFLLNISDRPRHLKSFPCRFGPLFTDFDRSWALRSTGEWARNCLLQPPNPLIDVAGFSVEMLMLA